MATAAEACEKKMLASECSPISTKTFLGNLSEIEKSSSGFIPESSIIPVDNLPSLDSICVDANDALLQKVVVLKLNGGLGTGMGLSTAKSLLEVKEGSTFLDYIVNQIMFLEKTYGSSVKFMFMNSFATSDDTKAFIEKKYPQLTDFSKLELMQNKVPKILQSTKFPVEVPQDPSCEWCPPGHGDLYAALMGSGKLDELIAAGAEYMFVSNSDNLGATLDLRILSYFAQQNLSFMMEVCERTESDKKGGHLARDKDTQKLLLRESAQCRKEDTAEFQNVQKHRYFNTNSLWINLPALKATMEANGGVMQLPVMQNKKTAIPTDPSSPTVLQLETAMGAAIASMEGATAIVVPRFRFAPVKTCNDLLSLRSDCYEVTDDHRIVLSAKRNGKPPVVSLEDAHYKFVDQFEKLIQNGCPSMIECDHLSIKGKVVFAANVVLKGDVTISNEGEETKELAAGTYTGEVKL